MPYKSRMCFYSEHTEGQENIVVSKEFGELTIIDESDSGWKFDTGTGNMIRAIGFVVAKDGKSKRQREKERKQRLEEKKKNELQNIPE